MKPIMCSCGMAMQVLTFVDASDTVSVQLMHGSYTSIVFLTRDVQKTPTAYAAAYLVGKMVMSMKSSLAPMTCQKTWQDANDVLVKMI